MRQAHLILSNAAIMWITRVFVLVPQLILVPYLIGAIGEAGYGVYALVWSLMVSMEQLQASLQAGVIKYSAGFLAQGRINEVNKVISSSFVYSLFLACVSCAGILIAAKFYSDSSNYIGTSLVVIGIMVLFIFPLTPYIAIIQSQQRYYVGAIAETFSKYIGLLTMVVWFRLIGASVEAAVVIMAGTLLFSRLVQVPIAYHLVPGLQNRPNLFVWEKFKLLTSFGGVIVLVGLCLMVNSTGIRWIMSTLASPAFVAQLAIILMPGVLLSQIILALTITVMPATSAYEATGNQKLLQELLVRGMRYTMILTLGGLIVATLLIRNVLIIWVGLEYEFLAPYSLALFASLSFMLSTSTSHHMLKGLGLLKSTVFISLTGLVVVPIGMILIVFNIWDNPYAAVITGMVAGNVVYGCLQIVFGAKAVHADLHDLLIRVYVQPITIALIVAFLIFCLTYYYEIYSLVGRGFVSFLALLLFFSGCYYYIATSAELHQIKELVQLVCNKFIVNQKNISRS